MNDSIPKLRFPGFSGEWQMNQLKNFITYKNGKSFEDKIVQDGQYNLITLNSIDIIGNLQPYHRKVEETDGSLSRGDLIMVLSDVAHGNFLGLTDIIPSDNFVLNQRMGALKPKGNIDSRFLRVFINNNQKYFKLHGQGSSQLNLSKGDIEAFPVPSPNIKEQQKIADFLTAVDERVGAIEQKLNLLKKYKKGAMQQIFSQKIRFRDENGESYGDWEEKTFGDIFKYEQPTKYIVKSTEYNNKYKVPVLTAGKTFILGYTDEAEGIFNSLPVVIFDDFTTSSHFVDFSFKVKSSAMKILKAKKGINARLAYELLDRVKFAAEDHKRHWIGEFQDFYTQLPSSNEQQKIADFLTSLDDKVNLTEQKSNQAKQFKKALLQGMFV